jgi:cobyrinic acid a,c-diamide synthase
LDRLVKIAQSKPWTKSAERLFQPQQHDDEIKVAVAFDEAFQGYYADTLDLLEARGAKICDFSPLRSEALPWDTDVVYMAGMRNDKFAEALSSNICLKQALRSFVGQGGRVYAEGAGLAYLCERMILSDGRQYAMTGLIPATAVAKASLDAAPTEVTFGPQVWLGEEGTKMRGYLDRAWEILPEPGLTTFAQEDEHAYDFIGDGRVLGSQLQVDFAGQPHLVASFFRPRLGALLSV